MSDQDGTCTLNAGSCRFCPGPEPDVLLSDKTLPYTTTGRTVIPCYCWVPFDGGRARCAREPGHAGAHEDYYAPARWPNRGPEPQ
ncbi:hypothetical protein ACWGI8_38115 [Streptomyces sp. NPDC054841]